jgi:pimeloyl-ACP methyl ester carboxylesterase
MRSFSNEFFVVAIDQRGYNLSDKPEGEENYNVKYLVSDVLSVIRGLGLHQAIIVGHDWEASLPGYLPRQTRKSLKD